MTYKCVFTKTILYKLWKFIGKDPIDSDWNVMASSDVSLFVIVDNKQNYSGGLDMLGR